jgi:hypothetical protein
MDSRSTRETNSRPNRCMVCKIRPTESSSRVRIALYSLAIGGVAFVQPVLAQDAGGFCTTAMGGLIEGVLSAIVIIAVAAVLGALLLSAAGRPLAISGRMVAMMNAMSSRSLQSIILLAVAIPFFSWIFGFSPLDPTAGCIPFLGG